MPALPFEAAIVRGARLELATPQGDVGVRLDRAALRPSADGLSATTDGEATWRVGAGVPPAGTADTATVRITFSAEATMDSGGDVALAAPMEATLASGDLSASTRMHLSALFLPPGEGLILLRLTEGTGSGGESGFTGLGGNIQAILGTEGVHQLDIHLAAESARVQGRTVEEPRLDLDLQGSASGRRAEGRLTFAAAEGSLDGPVFLAWPEGGPREVQATLDLAAHAKPWTAAATASLRAGRAPDGTVSAGLDLSDATVTGPAGRVTEAGSEIRAERRPDGAWSIMGSVPRALLTAEIVATLSAEMTAGGRDGVIDVARLRFATSGGRHGGAPLPDAELAVDLDNGRLTAAARLPSSAGTLVATARGAWSEGGHDADPDGNRQAVTFGVDGPVSATWLSAWISGARGEGAVDLDLKGHVPGGWRSLVDGVDFPSRLLSSASIHGSVGIGLQRVAGRAVAAAAATGRLSIAIESGQVAVGLPEALRVEGLRLGGDLRRQLPGVLQEVSGRTASLRVTGSGPADGPALTGTFGDGATTLAFLLDARAQAGDATLAIVTDSRVRAAGDHAPLQLATTTRLDVARLPLGPHRVSGHLAVTDLAQWPEAPTGRLDAAAVATIALPGGQAAVPVEVALSGRVAPKGARSVLRLDPSSTIAVPRFDLPGVLRTDAPLRLQAAARPAPALWFDAATGSPLEGALTLLPTIPGFVVDLGDGEAASVEVSIPAIVLALKGDAWTAVLRDGAIELPAAKASATGIALTGRLDEGWDLDVAIDRLRHDGPRPYVIPLTAEANFRGRGEAVTFRGRVADPGARLALDVDGRHRGGAGTATARIQPLNFLPKVLQPGQLFPVLRGQMEEVDGTVDGNVEFTWKGDSLGGSANLSIHLNEFRIGDVAARQVFSNLRFDSLFPPTTDGPQTVEAALIDIGIPLTDGILDVAVGDDGEATVTLRRLNLFGGRIESAPVTFNWRAPKMVVPLHVTGLQLAQLLDIVRFGDLTAQGVLDGKIPVHVEDANISIRGGVLEGTGGGAIQYRPPAGPDIAGANEGAKLFLDVIDNFQYETIRVTLEETPDKEIAFGFHIEGKNPAVYDGKQVQLNVNLSGPFRALLEQGYQAYTLPERMGRRLMERSQ